MLVLVAGLLKSVSCWFVATRHDSISFSAMGDDSASKPPLLGLEVSVEVPELNSTSSSSSSAIVLRLISMLFSCLYLSRDIIMVLFLTGTEQKLSIHDIEE